MKQWLLIMGTSDTATFESLRAQMQLIMNAMPPEVEALRLTESTTYEIKRQV